MGALSPWKIVLSLVSLVLEKADALTALIHIYSQNNKKSKERCRTNFPIPCCNVSQPQHRGTIPRD